MKAKFFLLILLIAAVSGGVFWKRQTMEAARNIDLLLYGNVDIREVDLAFRQQGRLAKMLVDEGVAVKSGDLIAELDDQPYRDSLAATVAEVKRAQAELDKIKNGNRSQEIKRAEESVRQAEAIFRQADSDYRRQSSLATTGAASERTLEASQTAHDESEAALAAARHTLSLLKEGSRVEDIAAAEARLASAEAARAQALTALNDTQLTAPSDAVVLNRVREPGSMVSNRDSVYTLSLRDPVYVRAYVSEPHLGNISQGTKVAVTTDSSGKVYQGHIGFISPRAEFTPKTVETTDLRTDLVYRLRIVVTNADDGLRQGMPVTVKIESTTSTNQG